VRVAVISPFYSVGGAENYSWNLSVKLSQLNNTVTLFVNSEKTEEQYLSKNLKITYLKSMISPVDPGNPFSVKLVRELAKEHYDVIHVHQLFSFFNISSSLIGRIRKTPTILTDHGGGWRLAAMPHICAEFPSAFAAVSYFSLRWMLHFAPKKASCVIYGGVDTNVFYPDNNVDELKRQLNLESSRIILCLGRVLPHKGIDILIRAFRFLPTDVNLLIVGPVSDYEYFTHLKALSNRFCPKKVIFTGYIKSSELREYYNVCDIFVQPSVYYDYQRRFHRFSELLGLTKFEAMACEKPVIVSRVGGLPEKITEGIHGYVVEPGNSKKLADSINSLLSDSALMKKMGHTGLLFVQKHLTWDNVAKRFLDFCKSIH